VNSLFLELGITAHTVIDAIDPTLLVSGTLPYHWDNSKQDSQKNRKGYIDYLRENLLDGLPFSVFDPTQETTLLDTDFGDLRIHGTADALISSTTDSATMIIDCHVLFELKKPTNKDNKLKQAQLELIGAAMKSSYKVISVLSDLTDLWKIMWIEKTINELKQKETHICFADVSRDMAIGFLRYHLKIATQRMKLEGESIVEQYDDADDNSDQPRKRSKLIPKSRPTFRSSLLREANSYRSEPGVTEKEALDNMIMNFCYINRKELGQKVQFQSADINREVETYDSHRTLNWLTTLNDEEYIQNPE
jgi:hypothetical protein